MKILEFLSVASRLSEELQAFRACSGLFWGDRDLELLHALQPWGSGPRLRSPHLDFHENCTGSLSFSTLESFIYVGVSQTCLGANVLSGLVPSTVFKKNLWAFLGPCVRGRGRPWYGTSAQPESHFTCSSPRGAPWVVPSTSLLDYFGAFFVALGRGEGALLVRYLCKTQKSLHGRHV